MAMTSHDDMYRRWAVVEREVLAGGWTMQNITAIAEKLGVHKTTVYRDWQKIKRATQRGINVDIDAQRREQIVQLDNAYMAAMREGNHDVAIKAVKVKAEITGTNAAKNVNVNVSGGVTVSPAAIGAVVDMDRDVRQRLLPENEGPAAIEAAFEVVETPTEG